jgi:hypothetical protein
MYPFPLEFLVPTVSKFIKKIKNISELYITPRSNGHGTVDSAPSHVFYISDTADIG